MKLILQGEREIRLQAAGDELEIESPDPSVHFSPLHMLAASLATCTMSVLVGWAGQAQIDVAGLEIGLEWEYVEDPYRVGGYRMTIDWPGLPEPRRAAALRAAHQCTVENTLQHVTSVEVGLG